jgi:integrase
MSLARKQVSPTLIQAYLGHSSVTTTMGYLASVNEEDMHHAAKHLEIKKTPWKQNIQRRPFWGSCTPK